MSEENIETITEAREGDADITDLLTGRRFKVTGETCGLDNCFCAAKIVEEI